MSMRIVALVFGSRSLGDPSSLKAVDDLDICDLRDVFLHEVVELEFFLVRQLESAD